MLYGKQHRPAKVQRDALLESITSQDESSYRVWRVTLPSSNFPLEQVPKFDFIACIRPNTQFAEKYLFSPFTLVVYADFAVRRESV